MLSHRSFLHFLDTMPPPPPRMNPKGMSSALPSNERTPTMPPKSQPQPRSIEAFRAALRAADHRVNGDGAKGSARHGPLSEGQVWRIIDSLNSTHIEWTYSPGAGFTVGQAIKDASEYLRTGAPDLLLDAIAYLAFAHMEDVRKRTRDAPHGAAGQPKVDPTIPPVVSSEDGAPGAVEE